ncbi:MAG: hypothetical protein N2513_10395 [Deltaproteobacteria bacterium]|nr:hypothetical protein [Deltaproteobacteria bacterium]
MVSIFILFIPFLAKADYVFEPIGDCSDNQYLREVGERISLKVNTDQQNNIVFTLTNNASGPFISEIYLYDYSSLGLTFYNFNYSGKVNYKQPGADPGFLPGFKDKSPTWSAQPWNPEDKKGNDNKKGNGANKGNSSTTGKKSEGANQYGIDYGESLTIVFSGAGFDQIIQSLDKGNLIFGIHVKGIDKNMGCEADSCSFIQTSGGGGYVVPLPSALPLLGSGIFGLSIYNLYKRNRVSKKN